jgi:hypothetical protein
LVIVVKITIIFEDRILISCHRAFKDPLLKLVYGASKTWLHILGVEFMKNVVEFRAQATVCRQLAVCDPKNADHWVAEAEKWSRLAQDEISSHYQECNVNQSSSAPLFGAR